MVTERQFGCHGQEENRREPKWWAGRKERDPFSQDYQVSATSLRVWNASKTATYEWLVLLQGGAP